MRTNPSLSIRLLTLWLAIKADWQESQRSDPIPFGRLLGWAQLCGGLVLFLPFYKAVLPFSLLTQLLPDWCWATWLALTGILQLGVGVAQKLGYTEFPFWIAVATAFNWIGLFSVNVVSIIFTWCCGWPSQGVFSFNFGLILCLAGTAYWQAKRLND